MVFPTPRSASRWIAAPLLAAAPLASPQAGTSSANGFAADFEELCDLVAEHYAYFDVKAVDWDSARALHAPRAAACASGAEFVGVLEDLLGELYDHHAHLGTNTASSPPLVPSGTDLWAEWRDGRAVITAVRASTSASAAGVRAGTEVLALDGEPIADAVAARRGRALASPDPEADDWALRVVLAGRRGMERRLTVTSDDGPRELTLAPYDRGDGARAPLGHRLLPGGFAHLRVHDSLGDGDLVAAFDAALAEVREAPGLLLDLRDTPSGGNTTVARAVLGRFVTEEGSYQRHGLPSEERATGVPRAWVELVLPRGPFAYEGPVVVLVGRWTGSMGEGLAIGFDGLGCGTVVGTRMAGLCGAVYSFTLTHTGIPVRIPAEALFHVDGTRREEFVPPVLVDLETARDPDPILAAGLAELRRQAR